MISFGAYTEDSKIKEAQNPWGRKPTTFLLPGVLFTTELQHSPVTQKDKKRPKEANVKMMQECPKCLFQNEFEQEEEKMCLTSEAVLTCSLSKSLTNIN